MGNPLTGTVIITGGNGLLGSEIAVAIAKKQPFVHLLLTARDIRAEDVRHVAGRIRLIGPRSVEVIGLELTDLKSVTSFAKSTVDRVRSKEIPPVVGLIHSAAVASYVANEVTPDGYDPVYQTNCVAPFLLTIGLLKAFRAGDGTLNSGAKVIHIGCSAASGGRLDYFDGDHGRNRRRPGTPLGAKEGNICFGSSKLIASVALYALRRRLVRAGNVSLDIFTLDPGGMTGRSHMRTRAPWSVRVAHRTRSGLGPLLRVVARSSMNKASVPAKAIAKVAFHSDVAGSWQTERYYILDREYEAASVLPALRDGSQMASLLVRMMRPVAKGSAAPMWPRPTLF